MGRRCIGSGIVWVIYVDNVIKHIEESFDGFGVVKRKMHGLITT